MNANGMARGYLAKQGSTEKFIEHFVELIGRVLKEYEEEFEFKHEVDHHRFIIKGKRDYYKIDLSTKTIQDLKEKSPYALDGYFWSQLKQQGFPLKTDDPYMETVLK